MFVMIRDGLFNSTPQHVGIHLRPLSGVNGVFARLALKVFEDTRPDVMCIQPPALLLLIDLLLLGFEVVVFFFLLYNCFCFSLFCHIFSDLNGFLHEITCQLFVCMIQKLPLHITASITNSINAFAFLLSNQMGGNCCTIYCIYVVNIVCCKFSAP